MIIGKNSPMTSKERLVHKMIDPKTILKAKHTSFESSINKTLGLSHILNDDEYNFMKGKRYL